MSIDWIFEWIICPIVKYPILLCFLSGFKSRRMSLLCVVYSAALFMFSKLNMWFRCGRSELWVAMRDIKNPKVLITGGSSGLGQSIVKELLRRYQDVTIFNIDIRTSSIADDRIKTYKCDLTDTLDTDNVIKNIKEDCHGSVHVIINNAGMRSKYQQFQKQNIEDFHKIFSVNTIAPAKIMQEFTPHEQDHTQCYVVNISSTLGVLSASKVAPYAASKAALIGLHRSYNFELEARQISNVRTLLVIPGQLNTQLFGGFKPPREFFAPVIDSDVLAGKIIDSCEKGERGDLCAPSYSNIVYLMMSLPYMIQVYLRKLAQLDDCLPDD